MDTKFRKLVTFHLMNHPRPDVECLNIKRENGERGLI